MTYIKLGFYNSGYCLSKKNNVSWQILNKNESKYVINHVKVSLLWIFDNKCPAPILFLA